MRRGIMVLAIACCLAGCTDPSALSSNNMLTVDERIDAETVRHIAEQLGYDSATYAKTSVTVEDFEDAIKGAKRSPRIYAVSPAILYGEIAVGARMNGWGTDRITSMVKDPDENYEDWIKVGHDGAAELYRRCKLIDRCKEL